MECYDINSISNPMISHCELFQLFVIRTEEVKNKLSLGVIGKLREGKNLALIFNSLKTEKN